MVIKQPIASKISILAAAILWLIGQSLLLVPALMEPVSAGISPGSVLILGGFCILAALATLIANFVVFIASTKRLLYCISLLALALLDFRFFQVKFYSEALLISAVCLGCFLHITKPNGTRGRDARFLTVIIVAANLISGLLLITGMLQLPDQHIMTITALRFSLAGAFLLSSLMGALPKGPGADKERHMHGELLAIPWLAWILLFIPTFNFAHVLVPFSVVALLLLDRVIPWNQFVLPEGDRIGRRLAITGALALSITIGSFTTFLNLLEQLPAALPADQILHIREWTLLTFTMITVLIFYGIAAIAMTVHSLMAAEADANGVSITTPRPSSWNHRIAGYLQPFSLTREGLRARLEVQADQINLLSRQLANHRHRADQFATLTELSQQLEEDLDPPVAAQLVVNTLERAIQCSFVCLYTHETESKEYVALASSGRTAHRPVPGYRQKITTGVLGRVTRLRKTQMVRDIRGDSDYIPSGADNRDLMLSYLAVPLISTGIIKGVIELESEELDAFNSSDVALAESMATELVRAWERSSYHSRLKELIQAGISLTTMVEPDATVREIATIARQTLLARFTYISLLFDREENLIQKAHAGEAPRLLRVLDGDSHRDSILKASVNAVQPFRVRDVRKYVSSARIELDDNGLRSMLVIPIRLHGLNIGAILAFGKQKEAFFSENDESLASLLASQAAASIESVWLQQELRTSLRTTRLLYELSHQIIQAEKLSDAARHIATTAQRLAGAKLTGIVLFKADKSIATTVEVDSEGTRTGDRHPMDAINEVMNTGRIIYQSIDQEVARICLPIQTPARKHGALWINIPEKRGYKSGSPADLQTLANQAALALERAVLMVESRQQAEAIEAAYHELELAYDRTLAGLISTLDARDRETEGHSTRVSLITVRLGAVLGLGEQQLKALERGALLHDIGKIGITDSILHKPGPLNEMEWRQMRMHPRIGARIIEGIPFLEDSLPVILCHHERWDGSGYPQGLKGTEIPRLARIFAVVDAFDALTSDRPYRKSISQLDAMAYLRSQTGCLFDPEIVLQFERLVTELDLESILPEKAL